MAKSRVEPKGPKGCAHDARNHSRAIARSLKEPDPRSSGSPNSPPKHRHNSTGRCCNPRRFDSLCPSGGSGFGAAQGDHRARAQLSGRIMDTRCPRRRRSYTRRLLRSRRRCHRNRPRRGWCRSHCGKRRLDIRSRCSTGPRPSCTCRCDRRRLHIQSRCNTGPRRSCIRRYDRPPRHIRSRCSTGRRP